MKTWKERRRRGAEVKKQNIIQKRPKRMTEFTEISGHDRETAVAPSSKNFVSFRIPSHTQLSPRWRTGRATEHEPTPRRKREAWETTLSCVKNDKQASEENWRSYCLLRMYRSKQTATDALDWMFWRQESVFRIRQSLFYLPEQTPTWYLANGHRRRLDLYV